MKLSKRSTILSESITISISTLARDLKAQGKDIMSFSAGEPDFDTPNIIKEAAKKALDQGQTKYTAVAGTIEVRQSIANKLERENNLKYSPNDIIVNVGAKHSLFNLFQILIEEGDEVIIPSPYWVTYPELTKYSGGIVVPINTDDSSKFKITPLQLRKAITKKTKLLILTTPSNPTGSVYTKKELEDIANVLKDTDITIISDEMYEKLCYDYIEFHSVASINDHMFNRTITVNGLSKSVAMTGWRFGYLATSNKKLIEAILKLQSQSTSNINSITMAAAIVALDGHADDDIETMRIEFEKRRNISVKLFEEINGLSVVKPSGAFYLYVKISEVENDSIKFCSQLLEKAGIAVVPGIAFGLEGYFRFSFATSEDIIKKGIQKIKKFVENGQK